MESTASNTKLMQLSSDAKMRLRKILENELGTSIEYFSDADINDLGVRLLRVTSTTLKRKIEIKSQNMAKNGKI